MNKYEISRRKFIAGLGGAVGLSSWVGRAIAQDQGALDPRRLIVFQRPVGTIQNAWWPSGTGTNLANYQLSRILQPLESFRQDMVVFRGLGLPHAGSSGGGHERGTVLTVTGRKCPNLYAGNGGDDPQSEGKSVDQLLLESSPYLTSAPVRSIQASCDQRADTPEVSTRHLSYSGARAPMRPYYQPKDSYERIFGTLMPGGASDDLTRARQEKRSVLDFALKDLQRMRAVAPASQRDKLDAYEVSVRELEKELDNNTGNTSCVKPTAPEVINVGTRTNAYDSDNVATERDDVKHRTLGELHLATIRAAFKCDLTRTVSFQWSPGTNHVSFADMWPPSPSTFKVHHTTSHKPKDADVTEFLLRIEVWYAQRLAEFIKSLKETTDMTGKPIFDTTVLAYITEVANADHSWDNMPWLMFGGAGTGFIGGQMWQHSGAQTSSATSRNLRSTNDYWMTLGKPFGVNNFTLGDDTSMYYQAIPGIFR